MWDATKNDWSVRKRRWWMYYLVTYPDRHGRRHLLYVGITSMGFNPEGILRRWETGHQVDKSWWESVDVEYSKSMTTEWAPALRSEAEQVEAGEIHRLRPSKNVAGSLGQPMLGYKAWKPSARVSPARSREVMTPVEFILLAVTLAALLFAVLTVFS